MTLQRKEVGVVFMIMSAMDSESVLTEHVMVRQDHQRMLFTTMKNKNLQAVDASYLRSGFNIIVMDFVGATRRPKNAKELPDPSTSLLVTSTITLLLKIFARSCLEKINNFIAMDSNFVIIAINVQEMPDQNLLLMFRLMEMENPVKTTSNVRVSRSAT